MIPTTNLFSGIFFLLAFFFLNQSNCTAQVVFSETFNEANNSTSGTDNTGGVAWTSSCPGCISGDYWYVRNGTFEGNDTNGDATWQSGSIDISSCSSVEVSFTLSETGTLEACGTGCNSADWAAFQFNINGSGWQDPSNAFFCSGGCAGRNVIAADDLSSGSINYTSGCIPGGNTIQIRIIVQNWAQAEYWRVDNINVACACSTLPVDLVHFEARHESDMEVALEWQTLSELNNDFFSVERSQEGLIWKEIGQISGHGTTNETSFYSAFDAVPQFGVYYYRLKQVDFSGAQRYSDLQTVSVVSPDDAPFIFPNPATGVVTIEGISFDTQVQFFTLLGEPIPHPISIVAETKNRRTFDISSLNPGTYLIQCGENTPLKFSKL